MSNLRELTTVVLLSTALLRCDGADNAGSPPTASAPAPAATAPEAAPASTATAAATASAAPEPDPPLNVLLLTVDSLRAEVQWMGYERENAPNLTKLAEQAAVYMNAYTVSSYTAKSVGAILSGRYPSTLYRGPAFFTEYSDANVWFTELLQSDGVRTMAGHAHGYFERATSLRQGFDVWQITPGLKWHAETDENVTSDKLTALAIEMLSDPKNTSGPFFLWLHYLDPHDQYYQQPGAPVFGRNARARYDSEIWFTDMHIAKLLDHCKKQDWFARTAIIVSSDHGEAFGEHGLYKHGFALWEVVTHVPMFITGPGVKAQRIEQRRSQIDLAPTIMELMGKKPADSFMGKSLVPEVLGREAPGDREPIVLDLPADKYNPQTRAILAGDHKLIVDGEHHGHKLYDLKQDPEEKLNLAPLPKEKANLDRMRALFDETWAKIPYKLPYGGIKLSNGQRALGPKGHEDEKPAPPAESPK